MRLIHSAAGLCMMLLACSVHTETMAASQKVNVGAADAQERAGVDQRGGAIAAKSIYSGPDRFEAKQARTADELVLGERTQVNYDDTGRKSKRGCADDQQDGVAAGPSEWGGAQVVRPVRGNGYADSCPEVQGRGVSGNAVTGPKIDDLSNPNEINQGALR